MAGANARRNAIWAKIQVLVEKKCGVSITVQACKDRFKSRKSKIKDVFALEKRYYSETGGGIDMVIEEIIAQQRGNWDEEDEMLARYFCRNPAFLGLPGAESFILKSHSTTSTACSGDQPRSASKVPEPSSSRRDPPPHRACNKDKRLDHQFEGATNHANLVDKQETYSPSYESGDDLQVLDSSVHEKVKKRKSSNEILMPTKTKNSSQRQFIEEKRRQVLDFESEPEEDVSFKEDPPIAKKSRRAQLSQQDLF